MAATKKKVRILGERNGASKLTSEQVTELRRRRVEEGWSTVALGHIFNISQMNAWSIAAGRTWSSNDGIERLFPTQRQRKYRVF